MRAVVFCSPLRVVAILQADLKPRFWPTPGEPASSGGRPVARDTQK